MAQELEFEMKVSGFEEPILGRLTLEGFEEPILGLEELGMFEDPFFCEVSFKGVATGLSLRTEPLKRG